MPISLGNSYPINFTLGNTQVRFLYMGDTKVWPSVPSASFGSGFTGRALASVAMINSESFGVFGDLVSYRGTTSFRGAKLNYTGDIDTTFATNLSASLVFTASVNGIFNARQDSQGSIYLSTDGGKVVKIRSNGTKDTTFNPGTGFTSTVGAPQADFLINGGSLVTTVPSAGGIVTYKGSAIGNISVIGTNGNVTNVGRTYTSERVGGEIFNQDVAILSSNRYLLCNVVNYGGSAVTNGAVRLSASLVRDTGYTPPFSVNAICGLTRLANGKIFYQDNSDTTRLLNSDGTADNTFNTTTVLSNAIKYVLELSDGKILIIGNFPSVNGDTNYKFMARLNSNGSLDTTFQMGAVGLAGGDSVLYSAVELDGFIYLVGSFTSFKGVVANNIIRVNNVGNIA